MVNKLPNIDFKGGKKNPIMDSPTEEFEIPFYKDNDYFVSLENFVSFVKAVESLVRRSDDYNKYIKYLREEIGLTKCQVLSNIETDQDDEDGGQHTKIEMHHGPILTLFDLAAILTDWAIANDKKITTFYIADLLLQEHFNNNVQVVMLSTTVHEQVHEGNVWININQAFGNLSAFIDKYMDGLNITHVNKINSYIEKSIERDSYHNGVLTLNEQVKNWNKLNKEW